MINIILRFLDEMDATALNIDGLILLLLMSFDDAARANISSRSSGLSQNVLSLYVLGIF